jgi:putative membrane protein
MADKDVPRAGSRSEVISKVRDAVGGAAARAAGAVATSTEAFMNNAASATLYELEAARIALRRSHSDDVRQFAQRMLDDHGKMKSELGSFLGATESPTQPPDRPGKLHQVLLDDLEGAADEDFDHRYVSQQQTAHREAITLFKTYEKRGQHAGLQNLCRLGLPVLEEHARMADALAEKY